MVSQEYWGYTDCRGGRRPPQEWAWGTEAGSPKCTLHPLSVQSWSKYSFGFWLKLQSDMFHGSFQALVTGPHEQPGGWWKAPLGGQGGVPLRAPHDVVPSLAVASTVQVSSTHSTDSVPCCTLTGLWGQLQADWESTEASGTRPLPSAPILLPWAPPAGSGGSGTTAGGVAGGGQSVEMGAPQDHDLFLWWRFHMPRLEWKWWKKFRRDRRSTSMPACRILSSSSQSSPPHRSRNSLVFMPPIRSRSDL